MSRWRLNRFARLINQGAVFAYPTDTIWGLGCHPLHASAVQRLLQIKQRSQSKGLILLAANASQFQGLVDTSQLNLPPLSEPAETPVTWIVKRSPDCPDYLSGGRDTLAIRITHHPLVTQLCGHLGYPLVSTSANLSGKTSSRNVHQIHKHFKGKLDFIIQGYDTGTNKASEIRDLQSGRVLRH